MSSSPTSSSSSDVVPPGLAVYGPMFDVKCPVAVMLGVGSITVRECLGLGVNSVLPLRQSAGEDLRADGQRRHPRDAAKSSSSKTAPPCG